MRLWILVTVRLLEMLHAAGEPHLARTTCERNCEALPFAPLRLGIGLDRNPPHGINKGLAKGACNTHSLLLKGAHTLEVLLWRIPRSTQTVSDGAQLHESRRCCLSSQGPSALLCPSFGSCRLASKLRSSKFEEPSQARHLSETLTEQRGPLSKILMVHGRPGETLKSARRGADRGRPGSLVSSGVSVITEHGDGNAGCAISSPQGGHLILTRSFSSQSQSNSSLNMSHVALQRS